MSGGYIPGDPVLISEGNCPEDNFLPGEPDLMSGGNIPNIPGEPIGILPGEPDLMSEGNPVGMSRVLRRGGICASRYES